ncbi:MAG: nuclease-related domain-containing protein [Gammaproteobacteria bacterium]
MTTFLIAVCCLLGGLWIGRVRQGAAENRGEAAVRRLLSEEFSAPDYHLLNNLTLPDGDGDGTTQIDHVLVSRFGVFVLESKHYAGWIYGSERNATWTQVLYKKHYKFQNPLRQNYKHVVCVSSLLDFLSPGLVHSVVVFTGDAVLKTPMPREVLGLGQLAEYLRDFRTEVISQNRLEYCVGRLECHRQALTRQTDVEHVARLNRRFGDVGAP